MAYIKGMTYIILWFTSIFAGYAIFLCPLLPLLLISNKWYRCVTDYILTFWQMYPASIHDTNLVGQALLVYLHGSSILVTGDPIDSDENILMVMNHRTRTDWNYLWPAVSRATYGRNRLTYPTKFVLKDPIRHVPGVGWMMQLGSYLYIKRNWEQDKIKMSKAIDYFAELKSKYSLLIFPEGTDLTANTKAISDKYADKMGLPHYEYVLHPRTTGFCFLAMKMLERRTLNAIYDVTIVYVDKVPQNERSLISGDVPKKICVDFQRYEPSEFGTTDRSLHKFLETLWAKKEQTIGDFFSSDRSTLYDLKMEINIRPYQENLVLALIFWSLLPVPVAYLLYASAIFRYIVLGHTVCLLVVNFASDGFQTCEIAVHEMRKRMLRRVIHEHHDN